MTISSPKTRQLSRSAGRNGIASARTMILALLVAPLAILSKPTVASEESPPEFVGIRTQYIAALADPTATSGTGAENWGLWPIDPGPRGVRLSHYHQLKDNDGVAPSKWQFDSSAWWLEEHGLIMEAPEFPMPAGRYIVTGDREAMAMLTIHPADENGAMQWELEGGNIFDVTHLRCRSAVYTPAAGEGSCTPEAASQSDFPVTPGAEMPAVEGCIKQDYAVLFLVAVDVSGAQ